MCVLVIRALDMVELALTALRVRLRNAAADGGVVLLQQYRKVWVDRPHSSTWGGGGNMTDPRTHSKEMLSRKMRHNHFSTV